jgi:hypothetical protein
MPAPSLPQSQMRCPAFYSLRPAPAHAPFAPALCCSKLRLGGSLRAELSPMQATVGADGRLTAERLDVRIKTGGWGWVGWMVAGGDSAAGCAPGSAPPHSSPTPHLPPSAPASPPTARRPGPLAAGPAPGQLGQRQPAAAALTGRHTLHHWWVLHMLASPACPALPSLALPTVQ